MLFNAISAHKRKLVEDEAAEQEAELVAKRKRDTANQQRDADAAGLTVGQRQNFLDAVTAKQKVCVHCASFRGKVFLCFHNFPPFLFTAAIEAQGDRLWGDNGRRQDRDSK